MNKYLVANFRSGNSVRTAFVIEKEGRLWLISQWLDSPDGKYESPARAIRVDNIQHQKVGINGADMTIGTDIPEDVISGLSPSSAWQRFEIIEGFSEHFGWIKKRTTM